MKSLIKISQNNFIQSELKPLSTDEKNILKKIRKKKSIFFFSTLAGFLLLIPSGWIISINMSGDGYFNTWFSDDLGNILRKMTPYFYLVVLILILIYFTRYYFQLIHPIIKDLKEGVKEVLYFTPEKYQTPFFAEYFVVTPVAKKQRIRISKELYDTIQQGSSAALKFSIHSQFIFSIDVDGNEIRFNETSDRVDV